MLRIADRVYLDVVVDDVRLPLNILGVQSFQLHSSTNGALPTGSLVVNDPITFMKQALTLADGMNIDVSIGRSLDSVKKYEFQLFNFKSQNIDSVTRYTLSFVLRKPKYFFESTTKSIKGTSYQALKSISESCDLTFSGDTTYDNQTWIPLNTRWCQFARKIASLGYAGDGSCMILGVTFDGVMRYLDYSSFKYDKNKVYSLLHGKVGDFQTSWGISGFKQLGVSGLGNSLGGYRMTTLAQNLVDTVAPTFTNVNVKKTTENMNLNTAVQGVLDKMKLVVRPIDCGNIHSSAASAIHQNIRIKLLQSTGLQVVSEWPTDIKLFDPVNVLVYEHANSTEAKVSLDYSGYYVVTEKTIYISEGAQYFEKFSLIRDGNNTNPSQTELK